MAFISMTMMAYDVEINGIYYNVVKQNKSATVTYKSHVLNSYSGNVVIPSSIEYEGVTCNVTCIGDDAFRDCSGLTSVIIPNSVTSIGNSFMNCTAIGSIDIPNSVTSIGDGAFSGCSSLTSITIPNSVTSIGRWAFNGCSGLTSITVASGNITYDSRNNSNAIIEKSTNKLIFGCKNTVIPSDVTSIGIEAFFGCTSLTSITIPNSVTSIGESAFECCSGLTSITIPNTVSSIGRWAFKDCSSLPVVNNIRYADTYLVEAVDKTQPTYTILSGTRFIGDAAFYGSNGMTSISIPNSVTSIGEDAFRDCSGLTSINIPNSVTSIGNGAFFGCASLTSTINIPNGMTSIGREVFANCSQVPSITIPNSVTSIGESAFYGCTSLTSFTIPNSVTCIGNYAFYSCIAIKSIGIPNSVTSIGDYAFAGTYEKPMILTSITIPNSVTSIGEGAFSGCSKVTSVTIPNSVTSIGDYVFSGCSDLTSIDIPNSVTRIGAGSFGYSGLTTITIPNSVTSIGDYAFQECYDLERVDLGEGLGRFLDSNTIEYNIGYLAFRDCPLSYVVCRATPSEFNGNRGLKVHTDAFFEYDNNNIGWAKLRVPFGYLEYFQNTAPWSSFGTIEELPEHPVLTANDYTLEYGDPEPSPYGFTNMGPAVTGTPYIQCPAFNNNPYPSPGTYPINISQGTVVDPNNEVSYVNGTLTITEAPLTISAKNYTIWVGDPLPTQATLESDLQYSGFKNGETEADLTTQPTVSCAATNSYTPGPYDITVSGATSTNYSITEVGGILNIREKETIADNGNGIFMLWGQNSPWQMTYVYQSQDTSTPPDNDWYKTSFDDSEWGLMTGPVDRANSPHFGLSSFFDVPDDGCALYLRRTFDIDATEYASMPDPLIMKLTVDDRVDVYLNDKHLGTNHQSDGSDNYDYTFTINKSDFLAGTNVLALYYHDVTGEAYLDYQLMSVDLSTVSPYTDNQGITYELDGSQTAWTVTGMTSSNQASIEIPGTLFGLPVTTINEWVFCNHEEITSITLNEGLTTIGGWAFYDTGITSLNIPASVTEIVTDHDIYDNYQPANAFGGCNNLANITVDTNNSVYSSPTGSNAIVETATNKLVVGCKDTDMSKLTAVTEIGYAAFHDLTGLTEFTIPNNITTIGEAAFYGCSNLSEVTVESSIPLDITSQAYPPFEGTKKYTLWVPVGSKTTYETEAGWSDFKFIFDAGTPPVYPTMGYAYFDTGTSTLNFVYDDQYFSRSGVTVYFLNNLGSEPDWHSDGTSYSVTDVVFDPSFASALPTSTHSWLREMPLNSLTGLEYLNTTQVTDMGAMFYNNTGITELDLSNFNASNVTDMSYMLYGCSGLTTLTLSESMSALADHYGACEGVGDPWNGIPCMLNVPASFNFNGTDTSSDFSWAGGYFTLLKEEYAELDTSGKLTFFYDGERANRTGTTYDINGSYTTSGATSVVIDKSFANYAPSSTAEWFKGMTALTSISGLENISTSNVSDMTEMFSGCSGLTALDLSNFDISSANGSTSLMLSGCSSLTELSVSESMADLASDACNGVGSTTNPCMLNVSESFDFHGVDPSNSPFAWKSGTFKQVTETDINIGSDGMTTYCSERSLDFTGVANLKAYIIVGYDWDSKKVYALRVNKVPAGTGVYLVGDPGTYHVKMADRSSYYVNMLVGTNVTTTIPSVDGDFTNLIFTVNGGNPGFRLANDDETVEAHRAYLQIPNDYFDSQPVEIKSDGGTDGDVNGDGKVTITDVMILVDIIMGL